MLDKIKSFFFREMAPPAPDDQAGASADELRIAGCALLLEVAYADDHFSEEERKHLRNLVKRHFGLPQEAADELIALAEEERRKSVDLWGFTALIRENYSVGQKMVLAEAMWGLVMADGKLASREDYLMRKISGLLGLKAGYLSEARRRVEESREQALKNRPD
ncbi:MAG: TerB family tellurite resistance protein [Gemmatimonadota bacterium]|nr:TerB family tellurite resistance protein [Gemmatimonadota bacterium]